MVTNIICECGVIAVAVVCVSCHIVLADTVQNWKMSMQPSHTIYINNLNEKIKKDGMLYLYISCAGSFSIAQKFTAKGMGTLFKISTSHS